MNRAKGATPHWPLGLRRKLAAAFIGVSLARWDEMVRAVDRAFALLDVGSADDPAGEEIYEFEAGPPHSEWPILTRPLPRLQERALIHMYEIRAGRFFCADGCGPKTYAALAVIGLSEIVGDVVPGKMPAYRLTKVGIEKGKYLKQRETRSGV
jgi:hypothetical protein